LIEYHFNMTRFLHNYVGYLFRCLMPNPVRQLFFS
jgi:hypothetical protein